MLRRTCFRLKAAGGSASAGAAAAAAPGAAAGLGDKPIFHVSKFYRPADATDGVTPENLAAEGRRTGRDAAAASVIDFIDLQWQLIPYRFRKLCLEVIEVRKNGVQASLPAPLTLVWNVFVIFVVYSICLRLGRGHFFALRDPKEATSSSTTSSTTSSSPAAAAAETKSADKHH